MTLKLTCRLQVERAFKLWSSGEYEPLDSNGHPVPFSASRWKDKTDEIMESLGKTSPKTWAAIISKSKEYVGKYKKKTGRHSSKGIVLKHIYGVSGHVRCFDEAEDGS
jgi:hypothetical protein